MSITKGQVIQLNLNYYNYDANGENGTLIASQPMFIPYLDRPIESQYIVDDGVAMDSLSAILQYCPYLQWAGSVCIDSMNGSRDFSNFKSFFPHFDATSNITRLAIENTDNGKFIMFATSIGGSHSLYESKAAYEGGATQIGYIGTPTTTCIFPGMNASTGRTRGRASLLYYYDVDNTGVLQFGKVDFEGVTSTQNDIRITGAQVALTEANTAVFIGDPQPADTDEEEDPYNTDPSDPNEFDDGTSDDIDFPSPPPISVTDTGFITLYNPSTAQLKSLANYMWSTAFDLDTFKKLFADPMDAILGLSMLPIVIPSSTTQAVTVGNIATSVSMTVVDNQYVTVDCGSVTVKRKSPGSYLDYAPYTKAELYLPCIGTHPLDVDEIMNKTIHIKYMVDVLSGACTAYVKVGSSVLYEYNGSCAVSVPITGNDWTNVLNGAVSVAASIGTMVATGGATAPMAAATIASAAVNNLKPNIEKSGSLGGPGAMMGVKRPYLILSRPNRRIPKNQNKYIGYPTYITKKLDDVSGYNIIEDIHLDNISGATAEELNEIETLLKSGVIL